MAHKAPGKAFRKGISLVELTLMFPDDATAEQWFIKTRWPVGVCCPECRSLDVQERKTRKPQPFRCRSCRKDFSVKTGTLMQGSNLGLQKWAIALYLSTTNLKGVSSMKLHRDLGITQKSAWHMMHRIRETWQDDNGGLFDGPVEVDETYIGGLDRNKPLSTRKKEGRGPVNKTGIIGSKERETGQVKAEVMKDGKGETLKQFVRENITPGATLLTDENRGYVHLGDAYGGEYQHKRVKHSAKEYVDGMAHTNGIESFWSMLKRGYHGTYHKMSRKHLQRYVNEFAGRHNQRPMDTIEQMESMVSSMHGKRLRYQDLVA